MRGRLAIGTLLAGGLLLVAVGAQKWFDARAAKSTVHAFMKAVTDGDRAEALSFLTPEARKRAETDNRPFDSWKWHAGVEYEIDELRLNGRDAVAIVRIEKDGYAIQPVIRLLRGGTTRWKIARIENLTIDPRWSEMAQAKSRDDGERLGRALEQALDDRPGVTIRRAPLPDAR